MAWKAKPNDVRPEQGGSIKVTVSFYDEINGTPTREFLKHYHLHPGQFPNSIAFRDFIRDELRKLRDNDLVKDAIAGAMDTEIAIPPGT